MRPRTWRLMVAGVALVALAAGAGAAVAQPAPPAPETGSLEPVVQATAVCPRPVTTGHTTSALGLVVAAPEGTSSGEGAAVTGQADLTHLVRGTTTLASAQAAATSDWLTVPESSRTVPAVMRAQGSLAPYATAGQVTTTTRGPSRGLSAVTCARPGSEFWFVGGGADVGRRSTLWLSNPDGTQAVVDLEVYGPGGLVAGHDDTGIVVPPHGQTGVRLDVVVPGTRRVGMHVLARAGRVSAALSDVATRGLVPLGADYVPASAPPATHVVVPGVLGGSKGARWLQVVAPGDVDAVVAVQVVAADGAFAAEGAHVVEVRAGSVAQVDLGPALGTTGPVSVVLDSDTPIVAGVRAVLPSSSSGGAAETTYAAGSAALTGPGAFGPLVAGASDQPQIVLTAPDQAAAATISVQNPGASAPVTRHVSVAQATTVVTSLTGVHTGAAVQVLPDPGSGSVYAALLMAGKASDGPLRTTVPLESFATTTLVPAVRPDPATGVLAH